jgi:hypothetical protein
MAKKKNGSLRRSKQSGTRSYSPNHVINATQQQRRKKK